MKKLCLIALGCVLLFTSCENTTAQNGSKQSKKAYDKSKSEIKNKGSNLTLAPDFELADLEGIYNTKFETNGVLGRYGTCVEIHAKNNSNAKEVDNNLRLTVGQNVVVQVYDYIKNGGGGGRRKYDKYVFHLSPV